MNVVIVTPGHPGPDRKSLPPALTAPYLAAIATPYVQDIKIYDLAVEAFDFEAPTPDVALFTATMAQFDQILKIALALKRKGSTIFFGGPYATLAYDHDPRIKQTFDCVILGEGEQALPQALKDLSINRLKPTYHISTESLDSIPFSRLDLLDDTKYYSSTVLIGTRGCINNCTYCSIKDMYGLKYLTRPVDEVIEEIKFQTARPNLNWLDRKLITFWDDNPACNLDWFHSLLEKMIPLKKWWLSQMCIDVADNEETIKLLKASGCKGIFVGLESVSKETLKAQKKESINSVDKYIKQAEMLLKHGICIIGAIMYGFDQDTEESLFNDTIRMADAMGLTLLQAHMVTPYPHSDFFKTLVAENRLITKEAPYYNGYTLVHIPKRLNPAVLQDRFMQTRTQFYSFKSILKRMLKHRITKYHEFLVWNAAYYRANYRAIPGIDVREWLRYLKSL